MQLKLQRSQRAGGITGATVYFCLDVRADYTAEEQDNIRKYRLGGEVIYSSQAAKRHIENASGQLDRTQSGGTRERAAGLARGAFSMAMAKMSLNITIASLGKGQHIECKDLTELMEAEQTVREACKSVTGYLDTAATFDGSEVVIEYIGGEERVHITQGAPPLLSYDDPGSSTNQKGQIIDQAIPSDPGEAFGRSVGKFWNDPTNRKLVMAGVAFTLLIFLLHSCFG